MAFNENPISINFGDMDIPQATSRSRITLPKLEDKKRTKLREKENETKDQQRRSREVLVEQVEASLETEEKIKHDQ